MATASMAVAHYDVSLFTRARSGDADAFASLAGTCEAAVFRIALRITGNMADAEDVRQQTLLKAFAHFDQFRDGFRFAAWITQIAANESISLLRRRRDSRWTSLDEMMGDNATGRTTRTSLAPSVIIGTPCRLRSRARSAAGNSSQAGVCHAHSVIGP